MNSFANILKEITLSDKIDFEKLKQIQNKLAPEVHPALPDDFKINKILGLDISYSKNNNLAIAGGILMEVNTFKIIEEVSYKTKIDFPYVPGFLAYREVPHYLKLLYKLNNIPDLVLVDGHGLIHPRKMGSAAHLGVLIKIPTIGIGKSKFIGKPDYIPKKPGSWAPIRHNGEILGAILKPDKGKPIWVSIGNLIDLESAVEYTFELIKPKNRLPEPILLADNYSRKLLKKEE
jgi:deoxyribonuclease V